MRVLVVEDEVYLAEAIRDGLRLDAIAADIVFDGEAALEAVSINEYDVIILDRDIPVINGDDVCKALSERPDRPGIVMVTASRGVDDTVAGLRLGADDYLSKPFEFPELIARVRALGRRQFSSLPPILRLGDLSLDPFRREVRRGGASIRLSRKEFAVLEQLLRAGGGVVSAEMLLEKAWDENADPFTHSVKVTISRLRAKLGRPDLIRTVHGAGYAIDA